MKELGTPMTRENYLELAYLKKNPVLSAEEETELPAQFQLRDPEEERRIHNPHSSGLFRSVNRFFSNFTALTTTLSAGDSSVLARAHRSIMPHGLQRKRAPLWL